MHKKKPLIMERKALPKNLTDADFSLDISIVNFRSGWKNNPHAVDTPFYRTFDFFCISHLLEGQGAFWHDEQMNVIHPGQAILICPGFIHDYFGLEDFYVEDTIDFTGPCADYLYKSGIITSGVVDLGAERHIDSIIHDNVSLDPRLKIRAKLNLIDLLLRIQPPAIVESDDKRFQRFDKLIRMIQLEPERWWTVADMAEFCNLSQVQFRRIFQHHVGTSPKLFVDEVKLKSAATRLLHTDLTLSKIASQFNYKDQFHFSRRFKKVMGMSPAEYRNRNLYGRKQ